MTSEGMKLNKEKSTEIPTNDLEDMKNHGAEVEKLERELYSEGEPKVGTVFYPSENIVGSALCPDYAIAGLIQREANSIVHYYASLREEHFRNDSLPEVGPPLHAPKAFIKVHHHIALSKLMETIQNPPDNYPTLTSLLSGSYICTVIQQWPSASVEIALFKH